MAMAKRKLGTKRKPAGKAAKSGGGSKTRLYRFSAMPPPAPPTVSRLPPKGKGYRYRLAVPALVLLFAAGVLLYYILVLPALGRVAITGMATEQEMGPLTVISLNVTKEGFDGKCAARIDMALNGKVARHETYNLGIVKANVVNTKKIIVQFPDGNSSFNLTVSCR